MNHLRIFCFLFLYSFLWSISSVSCISQDICSSWSSVFGCGWVVESEAPPLWTCAVRSLIAQPWLALVLHRALEVQRGCHSWNCNIGCIQLNHLESSLSKCSILLLESRMLWKWLAQIVRLRIKRHFDIERIAGRSLKSGYFANLLRASGLLCSFIPITCSKCLMLVGRKNKTIHYIYLRTITLLQDWPSVMISKHWLWPSISWTRWKMRWDGGVIPILLRLQLKWSLHVVFLF